MIEFFSKEDFKQAVRENQKGTPLLHYLIILVVIFNWPNWVSTWDQMDRRLQVLEQKAQVTPPPKRLWPQALGWEKEHE